MPLALGCSFDAKKFRLGDRWIMSTYRVNSETPEALLWSARQAAAALGNLAVDVRGWSSMQDARRLASREVSTRNNQLWSSVSTTRTGPEPSPIRTAGASPPRCGGRPWASRRSAAPPPAQLSKAFQPSLGLSASGWRAPSFQRPRVLGHSERGRSNLVPG